MTDETELPDHGPTNGNELAIVQIVLQQLTLMESRLGNRIDKIDAAEHKRWVAHDADVTKRWASHETDHDDLMKSIQGIGHRLEDHLRKEAQEELIFDARVGPLRRASTWVIREWRTVAIVLLLFADFIGRFAQDVINLQ